MKNEMRLQGIGMVEGTEAGKIQVGDILRWNYGGLSKVISFEFSATGKTIICKLETKDHRSGKSDIYERKMRVNRLVNIVASASTSNDFNLFFEPIEEEAPEAEEVVEVEEAFFEMKPSMHEVYYQITNNGTYVEIMLFVEDVANDIVLVSQQEGIFDSMAEAENLIEILKKSKNKIKYVETIAYTG